MREPLEGDLIKIAGGLLTLWLESNVLGEEELECSICKIVESVFPYIILGLEVKQTQGLANSGT